jgi:asparagine synthase (glutamine-hydrolysing)
VSGFAGIVRLEPTAETVESDRAALARMSEAIAFRGPDARQQWRQSGASFAFSLLTTGPAPQAPAQPVTVDGETWLLGDVRCDGRDEILRKLRLHGVSLSPRATSEELILHFFAQFGADALPELEGDFSFVLWNAKERRLLAFRDLSGCRPFFYSHRSGVFYFSNTLQAVLATEAVSRRKYDEQFLANFLLGSPYFYPERTVYEDVQRLPAGYVLEFFLAGPRSRRVANLRLDGRPSPSQNQEVIEEFNGLFERSVSDRLPDAETTIFLSGGLDSTAIATLAAGLRKKRLRLDGLHLNALTVDLRPLFEDQEGPYAERFAAALGIPIQLIRISHILPFDGLDETGTFLPEPAPGLYWMRQRFYFSRVPAISRVALTGDGGDEILRAQAGPYLRYLSSHSHFFAGCWPLLNYLISARKLPALGWGIRSAFLRVAGQSSSPPAFPGWFSDQAEKSLQLRARFVSMAASPVSKHSFNPRAYELFNSEVFAAGMEEQDPMWTGSPVECRSPFFDRRLLRFLLQLPPVPWFMEKELIRRGFRGLLPDEIRVRRKAPLPYDPLLLHRSSGEWSPRLPTACPEPLQHLVNWRRLGESLYNSSGPALRVQLRPVVLALWLKAVENRQSIQ